MRLVAVVVLAGCGFSHGQASPSDGNVPVDGDHDAPSDTQSATCYDRWLDNSIRFNAPSALASVNSTTYDRDPWLTADELTLYFSSSRPGSVGPTDIWLATRPALSAPFGAASRSTDFSSDDTESKLSISASGLVAVVGSDRAGSNSGSIDVWEVERATATQSWPAMTRGKVMMVESSGSEHDPTISADGMHLYLAPDFPAPQHIAMATRGSSGEFGAAMSLTEINGGAGDSDPSPTPDERIIVFSSSRTTPGAAGGNLYYATRSTSTGTFSAPRVVPDVNTNADEGDPHLSNDGCRLYFGRDTGVSTGSTQGNWDLLVATAVP